MSDDTTYTVGIKTGVELTYEDGFSDGYSRAWQECWDFMLNKIEKLKDEQKKGGGE